MPCGRNPLQASVPRGRPGGARYVPGPGVRLQPRAALGVSEQPALPPGPLHTTARAPRAVGEARPGAAAGGGTPRSNHKVVLVRGTEGSCSQNVQGVHQDQRPREVFPALGDGVLHPVQACVQLLDDIPVAVADLVTPGE